MATAQTVADVLTKQYPWEKFTFGARVNTKAWRFRYLISCIIVGGNSEANTFKADAIIFRKWPTVNQLADAPFRQLADILSASGIRFEGNKAKHIIATAQRIAHLGDVPSTRAELEALPGVGRHVASVILATVFGQKEFAVDVHVRRIAQRLGLTHADANDLDIETAVRKQVASNQWGHFSRSFVDFGQDICGFKPNCGACMLRESCNGPAPTPAATTNVAFRGAKPDGTYTVGSHTVVVSSGYAKCSCPAGRFKKLCKHVKGL